MSTKIELKTHEDFIASRWFCNTSGQEHLVTWNPSVPLGLDYLIVNIETGQCLQGGTFEQLKKELNTNFYQ